MSTTEILRSRRNRLRRRTVTSLALGAVLIIATVLSLSVGSTGIDIAGTISALTGTGNSGLAFVILELRLPRALLGLLAGFAFGISGLTFQSMLRNPLASPDIVGIASGASAAAVFGIVVLGWSEARVSLLAIAGALVVGAIIFICSMGSGPVTTRIILIGIGVAAMLDAAITYTLSLAASWDVQAALQWLTGSLNSANWQSLTLLAVGVTVLGAILLSHQHAIGTLGFGTNIARGLGLSVERTQAVVFVAAVMILALATAASGPIAFVALLSGPITVRLVGPGEPPLLGAGLFGAAFVLFADFIAQQLLGTRFPVGVVTGLVGAPYLVYLLIRGQREGGVA